MVSIDPEFLCKKVTTYEDGVLFFFEQSMHVARTVISSQRQLAEPPHAGCFMKKSVGDASATVRPCEDNAIPTKGLLRELRHGDWTLQSKMCPCGHDELTTLAKMRTTSSTSQASPASDHCMLGTRPRRDAIPSLFFFDALCKRCAGCRASTAICLG